MKLSIKEYMESRNVSRRTIYNRIENGQLETVKIGYKTYIIKENLNKPVKKNIVFSPADLPDLNVLNDLKENLALLETSYTILKDFDYSFLRERLSSIEKSLVNFVMDADRSNERINSKTDRFTEEINSKLDEIERKNDNFLKNFLLINEHNNKFFKESLENLEGRFKIIEEKLEKITLLEEKFDDLIKTADSKKSFGLFKK